MKKSNQNKKKKIPLLLGTVGFLLRSLPDFKGKSRIISLIYEMLIHGRNYEITIPFDLGERIQLNLDDRLPMQLFYHGLYEVEKYKAKFFCNFVKEGDVVLDVGAHIGYYTLLAAVRVGDSGHIHAFEPVSKIFERLSRNISINKITNVTLNRIAVSDKCGKISIFVADNTNTGKSSLFRMLNFSGVIEDVDSITIDKYLEQKAVEKVHLVKIDVEGNELAVLKGMTHMLSVQNPPCLLVEVNDKNLRMANTSSYEMFAYLKNYGFLPYKISESGVEPVSKVFDDSLVLFRPSPEKLEM